MAKQIKYTDQFRQEAVDMYQKGNDSASQVARKLGIHEHTMSRWIELYGKNKVAQELDVKYAHALEYIQAIKRQMSALEQLLLQQANSKAAEG